MRQMSGDINTHAALKRVEECTTGISLFEETLAEQHDLAIIAMERNEPQEVLDTWNTIVDTIREMKIIVSESLVKSDMFSHSHEHGQLGGGDKIQFFELMNAIRHNCALLESRAQLFLFIRDFEYRRREIDFFQSEYYRVSVDIEKIKRTQELGKIKKMQEMLQTVSLRLHIALRWAIVRLSGIIDHGQFQEIDKGIQRTYRELLTTYTQEIARFQK